MAMSLLARLLAEAVGDNDNDDDADEDNGGEEDEAKDSDDEPLSYGRVWMWR